MNQPSVTETRLKSLADRFKEASTKAHPTVLPIACLDRNPEQPRQHFDQARLLEMAETIKAEGVIEPLIVRPYGAPGRYQIVAGERRWRAGQIAKVTEVPVLVRELSDAEAFAKGLIENIEREDLIPVDLVVAVARVARDSSVQQAAKQLGKTSVWVSKRKRIAESPPFVLDFLKTQATGDVEALYELAKLAEDDPPLAQRIIADHTPGQHLRDQLRLASKETKVAVPAAGDEGPIADKEDDRDQDDLDEEEDTGFRNTSRPSGEMPISHAKGQSPERDEEASESPKPASPRVKKLSVVGVSKKRGLIVLETDAGDEVPCEFSTEARAQLKTLLVR